MIVKFFTRGTGSSKGVFDYLLKDNKQPDGKRLDADVLRGDIDNQALLIDSLDFKQKYTSGCLSFTETADDVTEQQKNELMDGFEQTIRVGLDVDRVAVSWIEHRDKGRLELNFVFANVDLEHGRAFQPYIHVQDKRRVNAWKDMQNIKHGFTDPNDPANKRLMAQRDNLPREVKDARQVITDGLRALAVEGVITSRDDVIQALSSGGFEIARETDKAISIKNPNGKRNIRLTGGLYERDFKFGREVQATVETASADYRARGAERYDTAKHLYDSEVERKREYHQARHGQPKREQRAITADANKAPNRYKYSHSRISGHHPSPFDPRFRPARSKHTNDDRELYRAYREPDRAARGQNNEGSQVRLKDLGGMGGLDSHNNAHTRYYSRGVDGQQVLKADLHQSAAANQLRAEITNGQTTARASTESITSPTGHDTTAGANAGRQRQGYSGVEEIIKEFDSHENARAGEVTETIRKLRNYGEKSNERLAELAEISKITHTNARRVNKRAIQFRKRTDSTRRAIEEVSECDSTARLFGEQYSAAREQYSAARDQYNATRGKIERISEYTEGNRAVANENNKLTRQNDDRVKGVRQFFEQEKVVIQEIEQTPKPKDLTEPTRTVSLKIRR